MKKKTITYTISVTKTESWTGYRLLHFPLNLFNSLGLISPGAKNNDDLNMQQNLSL